MAKFRRAFSPELKMEAVRQVTDGGRPVAEVAREVGVRPEQLRTWRKQLLERGVVARQRRAAQLKLATMWSTIVASGAPLDTAVELPTVVEFADYQCPFCRADDPVLDSLSDSHVIHAVFVDLPLTAIHDHALAGARAAICADQMGTFRAAHDVLMTDSNWQRTSDWMIVERAAGIHDSTQFNACMVSAAVSRRLSLEATLAKELQIVGTPTFVVSNRIEVGRLSARELVALARGAQ